MCSLSLSHSVYFVIFAYQYLIPSLRFNTHPPWILKLKKSILPFLSIAFCLNLFYSFFFCLQFSLYFLSPGLILSILKAKLVSNLSLNFRLPVSCKLSHPITYHQYLHRGYEMSITTVTLASSALQAHGKALWPDCSHSWSHIRLNTWDLILMRGTQAVACFGFSSPENGLFCFLITDANSLSISSCTALFILFLSFPFAYCLLWLIWYSYGLYLCFKMIYNTHK